VGDYKVDNTHPISNQDFYNPQGGYSASAVVPLDDDALAIQFSLWKSTQNEYLQALNAYKRIRNSLSERPETDSRKTDDFSREKPGQFYEPPGPSLVTVFDKGLWEKKLKTYSQLFLKNNDLVTAEVNLQVSKERQYFVSTEGARVVQNQRSAYLSISASIRGADENIIPLHQSYFAFHDGDLPNDEKIIADINAMIDKLDQLKDAPLAEPYTGPAILHGQASGVFFHEIFGHRVEGHRLKDEIDAQTFKGKINELVLPKTMSVVFDPTLSQIEGQELNGYFKFDDEGIAGQKVSVVQNGILKTFLMSRTPLESVNQSNGHGRAAVGHAVVSRQSNLLVEVQKSVAPEELRRMLVKECKQQGKDYGYYFKEVVGGYTFTNRFTPNAFNIFPTEVYRIYVDGRPDELVRGVDLIGTPLAMFAEIKAAANDRAVFTGFCGAESGYVPVSATSPSLFVRRIETQKKPKMEQEATLIARPAPPNN
jgi:TldD protein